MDTLNLKNKIILLLILVLVGCKEKHACKEYILSYNFAMLKIENINEQEIQNLNFFVKRNDNIINEGHLEFVDKLSKERTLVKFKFFKEDTIYKMDTIYVNFKNTSHYITGTKEVCVESTGTPFIKVYNVDGIEFIEGEVVLKN